MQRSVTIFVLAVHEPFKNFPLSVRAKNIHHPLCKFPPGQPCPQNKLVKQILAPVGKEKFVIVSSEKERNKKKTKKTRDSPVVEGVNIGIMAEKKSKHFLPLLHHRVGQGRATITILKKEKKEWK